jgi:hypothetical protein
MCHANFWAECWIGSVCINSFPNEKGWPGGVRRKQSPLILGDGINVFPFKVDSIELICHGMKFIYIPSSVVLNITFRFHFADQVELIKPFYLFMVSLLKAVIMELMTMIMIILAFFSLAF